MIKRFSISDTANTTLNARLHFLGYIYEKTEKRVRYALGRFVMDVVKGELSVSDDGKYATIRFKLPLDK